MLAKIVEVIRDNTSFLVTTHEGPDGDAIGSSLALASFLTSLGKDVTLHIQDPVPELYRFLPGADRALQQLPDRDYDVCFVLDVGEFRRAGRQVTECRRIGTLINLDHHKTSEHFGAINLIDQKAAATGIIVYRLIRAAGYQPDPDTARCLYVAIITDTGSFRYSNSDPEAFTVAGDLVALGVDVWDVSAHLFESQPRGRLQLLALALETLAFSSCGRFASITVTQEMYDQTGTDAELTDGFVNYPRSVQGVEVAVFFRQLAPLSYKVGFRSKGRVDVSSIAAAFGGGGHRNAAGCVVSGELSDLREQIFARLGGVR
jgi:phosphoesterase RecJ-like protein